MMMSASRRRRFHLPLVALIHLGILLEVFLNNSNAFVVVTTSTTRCRTIPVATMISSSSTKILNSMNYDDDNDDDISSLSSSSTISTTRVQSVEFVSPLLDYGYPPAVQDLMKKQQQQQQRR